jgi:hypothetical protein
MKRIGSEGGSRHDPKFWRERLNKNTEISVMAVGKLVRIITRKFPKISIGFVSAFTRSVVRVNAINARGGVEA